MLRSRRPRLQADKAYANTRPICARTRSALLASVLLATLLVPGVALAGTDDYPAPWRPPTAQDSLVDSWGYYSRECTSFVAWRLHSRNGFEMPRAIGHAWQWGGWAGSRYAVNGTPAVGAVAWWNQAPANGNYGHVAWVESVNSNGTVTIEEYNAAGTGYYNERTIPASAVSGYIHFKDMGGGSSPTVGWWGPWAGAPVIACEPNDVWLRANDNGSALTWVGGQANYGGALNDIGQFFWVSGGDFKREWWFPLNTSQLITLRGVATNRAGQGTSDYVRYITEERWFVAGDFDGDSKGDVARFVDDGNTAMSVWLGRSDGAEFTFSKAYSSSSWSRLLTQAVAGDVDGDGKDEIVALYRYGDNATGIWVLDWNGTGFTPRKPYHATSGKEWYKMKPMCADIDGDGRAELVVAFDYNGWNGYDTGFMTWDLEGATAAEPTTPWTETHDGWWDWSASNFLGGDFDGDGRDEIAALYNYGGGETGLWIFDGLSAGKFTAIDKRHVTSGWSFAAGKATVGDVDGDGRDEISQLYNYAGWGGFAIGLWTTDVDGANVTYTRRWTAPAGQWDWVRTRPLAADVDADGKEEVFAFYDYGGKTTREAWGAWFWRPDRGDWAAVKAWNKTTGSWTLAPDLTASFANPVAVVTLTAPSSCPYASAVVSGTLKTSSGGPISGRVVYVRGMTDSSPWATVATVTTSVNGSFSARVAPTVATTWGVTFSGDSAYAATTYVGNRTKPAVSVGSPHAPARVSRSRHYTIYGYLRPRHISGGYPVRIYKYRYVSGRWKSYGYERAKASDYSTYTRYSSSVRLPYRGKWKVRAYAPADGGHASVWSSGYDYVTVR